MKIGIIGHKGSIGQRHFKNAHDLGHEVAGYDPVENPNARPFLIDGADAIVVASPSKEHAHDLMDAIHAGKHVLVEKPFGYDCPPLLDGFIKAARTSVTHPDMVIATGFNCRFHHSVNYAKAMVYDGQLGDIQAASFSVLQKSEKPEYLRDGIIRNWLSHEIDLAHHFFGDGNVQVCTADDQREAFIRMKFPSVADSVHIQGDYFTEPQQRYFWIEGSKASIYVNLETREIYKRDKGGDPHLVHQASDCWDDTYIAEMKTFIDSIELGIHVSPLATAEDGVRALYTVTSARERAGI